MRRPSLPTTRPVAAAIAAATAPSTSTARWLAASTLVAAAAALALGAAPAQAHTRYSFNGTLVASPVDSSGAGPGVAAQALPLPGDVVSGWFDLPTSGDYGYSDRPDGTGTAKTLYWEIDYPATPETTLVDWALNLPSAEARKKDVYGNPSSTLRRTLHADGSSSLVIETSFMRGGGGVRSQDFKLTYVASDASLYGDLTTPLDLSKVTRAWGSYRYHDESFGEVLSSVRYDFELQTGIAPVPEPAAWWLWLAGAPLAWGARRLSRAAG
ncbi:MAG: hypothetical protein HZB72_03850 [Burkholderiales bacterium]|nr:hypothetical protein [Burkholderiales bacterium]